MFLHLEAKSELGPAGFHRPVENMVVLHQSQLADL